MSNTKQNNDPLVQADPGFHEDPPTVSTVECMVGPILVHTPNSGSPVTPINDADELVSPATVIENAFEEFSYPAESGQQASSLNKSESKDSGLHSENVSTSDTVMPDVSPVVVSSDIGPIVNRPLRLSSSDDTGTLGASSGDYDDWSFENEEMCSKSCCDIEKDSGVSHMCGDIVSDIVDSSVDVAQRSNKYCCHYRRQGSCEYNLNFEIPRISVSDYLQNGPDYRTVSQSDVSQNHTVGNADSLKRIESGSEDGNGSVFNNTDCDIPYMQNIIDTNLDLSSHSQISDIVFPTQAFSLTIDHSYFNEPQEDQSDSVKPVTACNSTMCSLRHSKRKNKQESVGDKHGELDKLPCKSTSNSANDDVADCLEIPRIQRLRYTESVPSSFSSCCSGSSIGSECEWDRERYQLIFICLVCGVVHAPVHTHMKVTLLP